MAKVKGTKARGINKITHKLADGSVKTYYYYNGARLHGEPGSLQFETALRAAQRKFPVATPRKAKEAELVGFAEIIPEFKRKGPYKNWASTTKIQTINISN